jgi:dimeric dUTPase (all-alpha-NTP-PPase superfamily)
VKHLNFREIYDRQIEFEKNFFNPSGLTLEQQVRWIKEFCLSAHDELSEVMKEVPWKEFHKYDKLYNMDKAKEEAIDVLKYSLNICIALGMTADDVINMFNKKSDLVEQRLNHAKEK